MMHWRSKSVSGTDSSSGSELLEDKSDSDAAEPELSGSSSSSSELPRKRRWAATRSAANGPAAAAAGCQSIRSSAEAATSTVVQGSWQRLIRLKSLPVNRWAKTQLQQEHKTWLKDLGWPIRGRRRSGAQQLSDQQLQKIARKLARRPTTAAVTPALKKAAGLESSRTRQGSRLQKWHRIKPRVLVGDTGGCAVQQYRSRRPSQYIQSPEHGPRSLVICVSRSHVLLCRAGVLISLEVSPSPWSCTLCHVVSIHCILLLCVHSLRTKCRCCSTRRSCSPSSSRGQQEAWQTPEATGGTGRHQ